MTSTNEVSEGAASTRVPRRLVGITMQSPACDNWTDPEIPYSDSVAQGLLLPITAKNGGLTEECGIREQRCFPDDNQRLAFSTPLT